MQPCPTCYELGRYCTQCLGRFSYAGEAPNVERPGPKEYETVTVRLSGQQAEMLRKSASTMRFSIGTAGGFDGKR